MKTQTLQTFLVGYRPSFIYEVGMRNARLSVSFTWLLGRQVHLHLNVAMQPGIRSMVPPSWKITILRTESRRLFIAKCTIWFFQTKKTHTVGDPCC